MIISASRRTDIPAFYSAWLLQRLRAGFCLVANPFNPRAVSRVSLAPADVDVIVFWSKNPAPLMPHLAEIAGLGLRFCFLFTLNDYPGALEPGLAPLDQRIGVFRDLAGTLGNRRVVWRYDPILLTPEVDAARHLRSFRRIAAALRGLTPRVILSVVDPAPQARRRMRALDLSAPGTPGAPEADPAVAALLRDLVAIAADYGLDIRSCAEPAGLAALGLRPGKCIDEEFIRAAFGIAVPAVKDPGQRRLCGCIRSRDIGARNTCIGGCAYCYATDSFPAAESYHAAHDPAAPGLGPA